MRRNKIRIALIDSGINTNINQLSDYVAFRENFKINENAEVVKDNSLSVTHEHGTAIALIIKHLCEDIEFYDLNIFDEDLLSDGRILLRSIEEALSMKPDIIHLSLGTKKIRYILKLKKLIREANRKNIIMVCALNNDNTISFPSSLSGVISVENGNFESAYSYSYSKGKFKAPFDLSGISGKDKVNYKRLVGNSMAAAYITGHISRIINNTNDDLSITRIVNMLKENQKIIK